MSAESVVVLERGAGLPSWIDDRAGAVSNVFVLAQRGSETSREFEARVLSSVTSTADEQHPDTSVLVCSGPPEPERIALCTTVLRAFLSSTSASDRSRVVLAVGNDESHRKQYSELLKTVKQHRGLPTEVDRRPAPIVVLQGSRAP